MSKKESKSEPSLIPTEINPCDLTAEQKNAWNDTKTMMGWKVPGFQHIFYRMLTKSQNEHYAVPTKDVPVAATDARNVMINPETFFKFGLPERVFVMAHEILHNVYGDVELMHRCKASKHVPQNSGPPLPYDHGCMNRAMDYRINALLVDSRIGKMPKNEDGTPAGCYDPKMGGANDSCLDIYAKVYKKAKQDGELGKVPGGFDIILAPGTSTGQDAADAADQRSPEQWAVEIAAARTIEEMRSRGDIPAALKKMFQELLEPTVPWTEHIKTIVRRRWGANSYDWRKPDRRWVTRDLYLPAKGGLTAGWLVIWGDTSGSISDRELEQYMGELSGIVEEVRPHRLTVVWCDCKIQHVDELEDSSALETVRARGVGGRGGTSIHPVMDWIRDTMEKPDMFIAFTDGELDFPPEPTFPMIWASVRDHKYPYGDVVRINAKSSQ